MRLTPCDQYYPKRVRFKLLVLFMLTVMCSCQDDLLVEGSDFTMTESANSTSIPDSTTLTSTSTTTTTTRGRVVSNQTMLKRRPNKFEILSMPSNNNIPHLDLNMLISKINESFHWTTSLIDNENDSNTQQDSFQFPLVGNSRNSLRISSKSKKKPTYFGSLTNHYQVITICNSLPSLLKCQNPNHFLILHRVIYGVSDHNELNECIPRAECMHTDESDDEYNCTGSNTCLIYPFERYLESCDDVQANLTQIHITCVNLNNLKKYFLLKNRKYEEMNSWSNMVREFFLKTSNSLNGNHESNSTSPPPKESEANSNTTKLDESYIRRDNETWYNESGSGSSLDQNSIIFAPIGIFIGSLFLLSVSLAFYRYRVKQNLSVNIAPRSAEEPEPFTISISSSLNRLKSSRNNIHFTLPAQVNNPTKSTVSLKSITANPESAPAHIDAPVSYYVVDKNNNSKNRVVVDNTKNRNSDDKLSRNNTELSGGGGSHHYYNNATMTATSATFDPTAAEDRFSISHLSKKLRNQNKCCYNFKTLNGKVMNASQFVMAYLYSNMNKSLRELESNEIHGARNAEHIVSGQTKRSNGQKNLKEMSLLSRCNELKPKVDKQQGKKQLGNSCFYLSTKNLASDGHQQLSDKLNRLTSMHCKQAAESSKQNSKTKSEFPAQSKPWSIVNETAARKVYPIESPVDTDTDETESNLYFNNRFNPHTFKFETSSGNSSFDSSSPSSSSSTSSLSSPVYNNNNDNITNSYLCNSDHTISSGTDNYLSYQPSTSIYGQLNYLLYDIPEENHEECSDVDDYGFSIINDEFNENEEVLKI